MQATFTGSVEKDSAQAAEFVLLVRIELTSADQAAIVQFGIAPLEDMIKGFDSDAFTTDANAFSPVFTTGLAFRSRDVRTLIQLEQTIRAALIETDRYWSAARAFLGSRSASASLSL